MKQAEVLLSRNPPSSLFKLDKSKQHTMWCGTVVSIPPAGQQLPWKSTKKAAALKSTSIRPQAFNNITVGVLISLKRTQRCSARAVDIHIDIDIDIHAPSAI